MLKMRTYTITISWTINSNLGSSVSPQIEIEPFDAIIGNATADLHNRSLDEIVNLLSQHLANENFKEVSKNNGRWIYEMTI